MKTSVVLLALATAALAAPALHEEAFDADVHIPAKYLDAFTRERKSTLESSSVLGTPVSLPSSQVSEFGVTGRTFNLKKPIIIKKNQGSSYQVYRDSAEEKLDSPVPCRNQVRVNLCDEHSVSKSADAMGNLAIEDSNIHNTEDDMKHSIKLAKEAVENLQNDLRKIEHTPTKPWKHGDSESDAELHQDIEVARQALEHIHNNFGIMETLNTHDTTLKEAGIVEDLALPLARTEEERLAQWKDAIENIERNVELARNIEDSFKSFHDATLHTEEVPTTKDINKHELSIKEDMRVTENSEMKDEKKPITKDWEHSIDEKLSEHNEMKTDLEPKDMLESASMVSASKLQSLDHNVKARLTPELQVKSDHIDVLEHMTLDHLPQNMDIISLKTAEEAKEEENKREKITKLTGMEHVEAETKAKMTEMESADKHSEMVKNEENVLDEHHALVQLKKAEDMKLDTEPQTEMKTHESMMLMDHSVEGKSALKESSMVPAMTSESMAVDQHNPMMGQTIAMKSAEDTTNMHHQINDQSSHMRWAQDKHFNTDMGVMKSAAETHQAMDHHMHSGHHHAHQHDPHHLDHHGNLMHQVMTPGMEHFMPHGKSADMESNYYMNMRDSDNLGQEHRFKWRPTHRHESARTAYGAPAPASAPATGAIGLFPNANVGGCGIPLLLSCNPSVVSGSLAKAHTHTPSYSAPAYRTEDDFNFHSKRDVKKSAKLVNRTPTNLLTTTH